MSILNSQDSRKQQGLLLQLESSYFQLFECIRNLQRLGAILRSSILGHCQVSMNNISGVASSLDIVSTNQAEDMYDVLDQSIDTLRNF